jgi:hypothetical protein
MKYLVIASAVTAVASLAACTSTGNTERGAVTGALLGGAAGAIIGNNTGSGDAGQGAAIGAATGAIAGGVAGAQSDRNRSANYGPNGEPLLYDNRANRYYYVDRRSGRTYWANGDYRG